MSRRSRKDQQRVTLAHHVRALPQATIQSLKQRRQAAALSPKIVGAAYEEYKAGISLPELASRHWQEWQCETKAEAERLIRVRFRESGFALRKPGRPQTSGASFSRAPSRAHRLIEFSERARAEYRAAQEDLRAAALADPVVAQLVADQEKDDLFGHRIKRSARLVSLDELDAFEDSDGDSRAEREAVRFARRRGDFRPEAPWVPAAIARADTDLRQRSAVS